MTSSAPSDKTRNLWPDRRHFIKHDGKYDLVLIDHGDTGDAPGSWPADTARLSLLIVAGVAQRKWCSG